MDLVEWTIPYTTVLEEVEKSYPASEPKHLPALDGLRGLAILAVMFNHYGAFVFTGSSFWQRALAEATRRAYLGVDLFFVLSGFLITGILMESRHSPDYWPRFYWRRSLRIFPLYFFYLLLVFCCVRPFFPGHFNGADPVWYFTYLSNWTMAEQVTNPYLAHLWSLAVEEQFYLVWPFVVLLFPGSRLGWFCLATVLFSAAFRAFFTGHLSNYEIYIMTPCRIDTLAAGAFIALAFRNAELKRMVNLVKWPSAAIGLSVWIFTLNTAMEQILGYTAAAAFFAAVVFWAAQSTPRFLTWAPFRSLGKYSYGIYMFHVLPRNTVFNVTRHILPGTSFYKVAFPLITFAIAISLARISWKFLEAPFLRMKDRFFASQTASVESNTL